MVLFFTPPVSERRATQHPPNKMNSREALVIIFLDPTPFDKRNTFLNEEGTKRFIPFAFSNYSHGTGGKFTFNCVSTPNREELLLVAHGANSANVSRGHCTAGYLNPCRITVLQETPSSFKCHYVCRGTATMRFRAKTKRSIELLNYHGNAWSSQLVMNRANRIAFFEKTREHWVFSWNAALNYQFLWSNQWWRLENVLICCCDYANCNCRNMLRRVMTIVSLFEYSILPFQCEAQFISYIFMLS